MDEAVGKWFESSVYHVVGQRTMRAMLMGMGGMEGDDFNLCCVEVAVGRQKASWVNVDYQSRDTLCPCSSEG